MNEDASIIEEEINSEEEDSLTEEEIKSEMIADAEDLFDNEYYESLEHNNKYYITIPYLNNGIYLKDLHISAREFFKHSIQDIQNYISYYTISENIPKNTPIQIVKTCYIGENDFCVSNLIIKTFWIKLIQRTWRNILKKRKQRAYIIIKNREYGIFERIPGIYKML